MAGAVAFGVQGEIVQQRVGAFPGGSELQVSAVVVPVPEVRKHLQDAGGRDGFETIHASFAEDAEVVPAAPIAAMMRLSI